MKTSLTLRSYLDLVLGIFSIFFFTISQAQSPSSSSVAHYNSGYNYDGGKDIHVGGDGRIYVAGYRNTAGNGTDGALISYTSAMSQNWANFYDGPEGTDDILSSVTTYGSGSSILIYATGRANDSGSNTDMLLTKYTQSGTRTVATWSSAGDAFDEGKYVLTDASGNIYVAGIARSSGSSEIRVWKYNSSLTLQYTSSYNTAYNDIPTEMKIDDAGDYLYVCGYTMVSESTPNNYDAVLVKFSTTNLTYQWASVWDNTAITGDKDMAQSLAIAGNGDIYTAGQTQTASNVDGLLLRYNTSGTLVHAATTWNNSTHNLDDWFMSIASNTVSGTDYVYVTGSTTYDPNQNPCDFNIITNKYTATCCSLTIGWSNEFDSNPGLQCPSEDWGYQILISPQTGKIHVGGISTPAGLYFDYCGIRYSTSGTQEWIKEYNRSTSADFSAEEFPIALEYSSCWSGDNVILTGKTYYTSQFDITTVKYYSLGNCEGPEGDARYAQQTGIGSVKVYPVPANDVVVFEFPINEDLMFGTLIIYDLFGREIGQDEITTSFYSINLESFSKGIYSFRFLSAGNILYSGRFVVN